MRGIVNRVQGNRGVPSMACGLPDRLHSSMSLTDFKENIMGKYFIAWLLGVPGIVLVLLYLFFH